VDWGDRVDSFLHEPRSGHKEGWSGRAEEALFLIHGSSSADLRGVQLSGFADAPEKAYGAVVYLRVELISGTVFTQLVSSKT